MDDIQRKLSVIDRQLAGGKGIYRQVASTSPLLFPSIGLMVGILIQNKLTASWMAPTAWIWLIVLAMCCLVAILLLFSKTKSDTDFRILFSLSIIAFFCFACLGAIRLTSYYQPKLNDIRNLVTNERKLATIRGLIVTEPYINRNQQWQFVRFTHNDPSSSFYLKLNKVKTVDDWAKASGTLHVYVDEPILDLKAGDYIQAYCWLDRFKQPTNPGQFNIAKYFARKNVFIAASVTSRDGIVILEKRHKGFFAKIKRKLKETTTQALLDDSSPDNPSEGLLQALLLGYRGNIDNTTYEAFRKTGLLHFISLSGMHLGIFVGIIWLLCKTAGLMKRARAIICIIAIGVFLLIVPPRAPTVRAAIIGWVFCVSFFFRRRPNSINTLSLAAIILLLIRPTQLFEAGWQLSFASVLGIILFTGRIEGFLYDKIIDKLLIQKILKTKLLLLVPPTLGSYLLKLFSIALAAWVAGAGLVLYHFHMITPFTCIWKLAMFPLVTLILAFGYLKIILSFLVPTVAIGLGVAVKGLAISLIWIVVHIARLDIGQILIGHVPLALIILYYCLIFFAAFAYYPRPLIKKTICTTTALIIIVFLGVTKWQRTHRDSVILTCLDVGHGQAILAQLPGKANILFDVGSLYKSDIGKRIVTPFLDYNGTSKIDAIIISHNDIDHINGIPEIVEHCKVEHIYANNAFFKTLDTWGTSEFLNNYMQEKDSTIEKIDDGLDIRTSAVIQMLWPDETISQFTELSDNDSSLVCSIEFAGRKILLCSDIEEFAQRKLLRLNPDLRADIVVLPHHGSGKTLVPEFLRNLGSEIMICSCSQKQYKRQHAIENAKAFYTATDGAINVCIDKNGTLTTEVFVK